MSQKHQVLLKSGIRKLSRITQVVSGQHSVAGESLSSCFWETTGSYLSSMHCGSILIGRPPKLEGEDQSGSETGLFGSTLRITFQFTAHLVPVFSFGENELFKQVANPKGSWLRTLQERLRKIVGFTLPLFHARGIFQYSFGLMPYRKPIHTVVGKPITVKQNLNPTLEEIEQLHQTYLRELSKLFEDYKEKYGIPDHESLIFK
ncbi:hypothetical protein KIL84_023146 [Mauremys mutica]|uniref:2-acylglycerol O-acyltransferase 1 n=1 Tax=Mauremys mutica TaxID=74926 RepID=A0A9D3WR12_9SAUR|nr:hypothetical protein KIL84_023146 [Mauremys mutica]